VASTGIDEGIVSRLSTAGFGFAGDVWLTEGGWTTLFDVNVSVVCGTGKGIDAVPEVGAVFEGTGETSIPTSDT